MFSETKLITDRGRRTWQFCLLGFHLLGMLTAILAYRLWLYPAHAGLRDRREDVLGAGASMGGPYMAWDWAVRHGDKEYAKNLAARSFEEGMKEISPRLTAYIRADDAYQATRRNFTILYIASAVVALLGLLGYLVLAMHGTWLRCGIVSGLVGLVWGAAGGLLFDSFSFEAAPFYRTDPYGIFVGAASSAIIGFLTGAVIAALANWAEKKPEPNPLLQPTGQAQG